MTIHRIILTGTAALVLGLAATGPAQAQVRVYDLANYLQSVEQVTHLTQQLTVMRQQYQQLQQTYAAMAHLPQSAVNDLGRQLNVNQFRNALPAQSRVLGAVMNGAGLEGVDSGSLAASAQSHLQQNRIYAPAARDFQALEMQRIANSVAGAQAMASELYQSAADRVVALQDMESQLAGAPDSKAVADLQARIAAEQAYIQAQQVQAQSLAMWQASQERNQQQRSEEERRRQIDNLIEAAKAHGG